MLPIVFSTLPNSPNTYTSRLTIAVSRFLISITFLSYIWMKHLHMDLKELFTKAVADSKELPDKPSNQILLQLYSLYKQAETGDAGNEAPANLFDIVAQAKYDAWNKQRGKSKEAAMREYIDLVEQLKSA